MAKAKRLKTDVKTEIVAPVAPTPFEKIIDEKRSLSDTRLSYSSYTLLKACEQKYWHYKINNTPVDSDYNDEKKSLILGKAFHTILEFTKHTDNGLSDAIAHARGEIEENDMALVVAMVKTYLSLKTTHFKFKDLVPVAIELQIADDKFIGFIDVIFKDSQGNWYIGDLKTTARHSENLKSKLEMDAQLNLYSSYKEMIAGELGLDLAKFSGALYISTNKTTTRRKDSEKLSDYVNRLMGAIETRVYVVPISEEKTKWVVDDFTDNYRNTQALRQGLEPSRNYSRCEDYFSPCQYFSQCHGHNYSNKNLEIWS